jgi:flagellar basal-body rod protein FlgB
MDLFDNTQLGLDAAIRASAARQQAIAQNIANVNTPGYRRVEVPFEASLRAAMGSGRRGALENFHPVAQQDMAAPVRVDGSSVDIDTEAAAQSANGLQYESLVQVMRARIDILESAMGNR